MEATELNLKPVGGFVRDLLSGHKSHDLDLVCVHPAGFQDLQDVLTAGGNEIVKVNEGTFVLVVLLSDAMRAKFGERKVEIVFARFDGPSSDGRHPDFCVPGTLEDDLNRRDFTINAMALDGDQIIDLHGGQADLESGTLRFVGDPSTRIAEDALRVLRALRFCVTKNLVMAPETFDAVNSDFAAERLASCIPVERVDTEISKMLAHDPVRAMEVLIQADKLHGAIFRDGLGLCSTLKKRKCAE